MRDGEDRRAAPPEDKEAEHSFSSARSGRTSLPPEPQPPRVQRDVKAKPTGSILCYVAKTGTWIWMVVKV